MSKNAPATDPFAALAEPRRRQIVDILGTGQRRSVNDLVDALGLLQPAVSKHLGILRKAGLVTVEKNGQHRYYALNPDQLKPIHNWLSTFEHFWTHHLEDIKKAAERTSQKLKNSQTSN